MVAVTLLAARLAAYEPDGPRFATALLDPSSWDATFAFNDAGSLQVKYARQLDPIGMLGRPVELAAEVWDGSAWVEPRNGRFVATEDQSDDAADLDVASYTLKSYATLLNRVQVLARPDNPVFPDSDRPDYTDDGSREFWTATAGQVVLSLLNEHRQRYGTLPGLTVDFTSTHDSAGHPWAEVRSLTYSPGTTLLDVLADLASYALIDWWVEGRKLRVFNAGTQQVGRTVRMHLADAESAPVRGSWDGIATVIRLEGVDGQTWEKAVPGAPKWWGPKVRTVVNSSVADDATAQAILDNEALLAASKRTEYTRTLKDFKQRPLLDFQVGDTIPAKNAVGVFEQMRVFEIGLSLDADGFLSSTLTLNDRFVDADVRFQRRLKGATSGADDVGGDGSIPNNLTPAVPAQVKGLTVGTLGYWKGAVPRSSVQVDWADVSADVNGYAIELLRYDVEVSGRTTAVPAADIGQRPPSQAGIANLDIDTPVVVRVRAVSATGVPGAWSASVSITTDRPYLPMDPPTSPALSVENGIVTVTWDGKLKGTGNPYSPPSYFDRVDVYEASTSTGPWSRIGTIRAGMLILDRQSILGQTRFYRGMAIDLLGVTSPASPTNSIAITSAISAAVTKAQTDATNALNNASTAQTTANGANARLTYTVGASKPTTRANGSTLRQGDELLGKNTAGNTAEAWIWNGSAWVRNVMIADSVFVPGTVGTVSLAEGAVTAVELYVDQAMIDVLAVGDLWAGKVTTQMFSTQAAFEGPGVKIDRTGVDIMGSGSAGIFMDSSSGLVGKDSTGAQTFRIAMDGSVTLRGSLTAGSTIAGSRIVGSEVVTAEASDGVPYVRLGPASSSPGGGFWIYNAQGGPIATFQSAGSGTGIWMYENSEESTQGATRVLMRSDGLRFYKKDGTNASRVYARDSDGELGLVPASGTRIALFDRIGFANIASTTGGFTVKMDASWNVKYESSARRFKIGIRDTEVDPSALLDLHPRMWEDRGQMAEYADALERAQEARERGEAPFKPSYPTAVPGLIAEEVQDAGLDAYCTFMDGELAGIQYERLWTLLIPLVRDLRDRVTFLEGQAA